MRAHIVISFWFGIVDSLCHNETVCFVFSVRVSLPHRLQPLEVLFPQHGLSLFFLPLEVFSRPVFDQTCRERSGILHFVIWHRASPGGVAPLLSHCDEWDEINGTARAGLLALLITVGFPPVCQE